MRGVDYLIIIPSRWETPSFFLLSPFTPFSLRETEKGKVLLFLSGVGKANIIKKLPHVLDRFSPCRVILSGFCGARREKFPPGTLVLGKAVIYGSEKLEIEKDYLKEIAETCKNFPFPRVKEEIECLDKLELLKEKETPPFVDMESFWVMKICRERAIPTAIVKAVSDNITSRSRLLLPFYLPKLIWKVGRSRKQVIKSISLFLEKYFYS